MKKLLFFTIMLATAGITYAHNFYIGDKKISEGETWTPQTHPDFIKSGSVTLTAEGVLELNNAVIEYSSTGSGSAVLYFNENTAPPIILPGFRTTMKIIGDCSIKRIGGSSSSDYRPALKVGSVTGSKWHSLLKITGQDADSRLTISSDFGQGIYLQGNADKNYKAYLGIDAFVTILSSKKSGIRGLNGGAADDGKPIECVQVMSNGYLSMPGTYDEGTIVNVAGIFYGFDSQFSTSEKPVYPASGIKYDGNRVERNNGQLYTERLLAGKKPSFTINTIDVDVPEGKTYTKTVSTTPANAKHLLQAYSNNSTIAQVTLSVGVLVNAIIKGLTAGNTTMKVDMNKDYPGLTETTTIPINVGYPLYVCGTMVHPGNASDIKGPGIAVTSNVSYDAPSKTLTLANVLLNNNPLTFSEGKKSIIYAEGDLTINLPPSTNSTIVRTAGTLNEYGIYQRDGKLKIQGTGTLSISVSSTGTSCGIDCSNVEITGGTITIQNVQTGISAVGQILSGFIGLNGGSVKIASSGRALKSSYKPTVADSQTIYEGDAPPGTKVSSLTFTQTGSAMNPYYESKKYIYVYSSGSGLASLASQGIQVRGGKGVIEILAPLSPSSADGGAMERIAAVYNLSGSLVRSVVLSGERTFLSVDAGNYIVRIGKGAEKVAAQ